MATSSSASADGIPARTLLVGSGKLGARLGARLVERGGVVFALRRNVDALDADFIPLAIDLSGPIGESLPAFDAMVITLPPGEEVDSYRRSLGHLADALPAVPARTVFVSSTGVFEGWTGRQPIDESDEPVPSSPRSAGLLDGERAATELFSASIIRPAGIYGPGRDYLIRRARSGEPIDHTRRTNRIHETDLIRTLELMLVLDDPPAVLHAVDQRPAPLGEVLSFVSEALGVPVPPATATTEATGNVFDGGALRKILGRLEYPDYRAGYREMIELLHRGNG